MTYFYPGEIQLNTNAPVSVITVFSKFNREVELSPPISERKRLELSYTDYVFSFELSALDFLDPRKNEYRYKMEGFDKEWFYTDWKKRFATYTNLDPGEYTFLVEGANNHGKWSDAPASLKVIIEPPFWGTFWFRAFGVLVVLVLIYLIYGWRQARGIDMPVR